MISSLPNKLYNVKALQNKFFGLRHGQSLANISQIISSDPEISTKEHGLSTLGKEQVSSSANEFVQKYNSDCYQKYRSVAIFSSDFTRARETAFIFADTLRNAGIPLYHKDSSCGSGVKQIPQLRERFFGDFNGKSDSHYEDVWRIDKNDADHTEFNCESVNSVVERTSKLITVIDEEIGSTAEKMDGLSKPCKVILVAHGDVLQILQTAFLKKDGSVHRSLDHLDTAGLREYVLGMNYTI